MLQPIQEPRYGDVRTIPIDQLVEEWKSDAPGILDQARQVNLQLNEFLNLRAAKDPEDPRSLCPVPHLILENVGIRVESSAPGRDDTTRIGDLPDIGGESQDPLSELYTAYLDDVYREVLLSGRRALTALTSLQAGSQLRPYYDEMPIRYPEIAPDFDFRNVVARIRSTREDVYRINRLDNEAADNMMKVEAEGAEGKIVKLIRSSDEIQLLLYRLGYEISDSFRHSAGASAEDVRDGVVRIAIGQRILNLYRMGVVIRTGTPTATANNVEASAQGTIGGVAHTAGEIKYPLFLDFTSSFGPAYQCNVVIGNRQSVNTLRTMSLSGPDNVTFGSVISLLPNANFVDLNGGMMNMSFGHIDNDDQTGFTGSKLWCFDRDTTLVFVQRPAMDQDELQRDAGRMTTRRWFGTSSNFGILDNTGMKTYAFG